MAFPVTLNGRTYTLTDFEGTNYVDGLPDAFEDFVTQAGDIYNSTSTTSNSIGTGSKTFTVEANKPYQAGTPLRIADAAAPSTNFLDTVVTSYSGTTLVVNSIGFGGSGTKTSWTVNIGGAKTVDGTLGLSQGGTGATDAAGARTNIDVYSKSEADTRYLNISGDSADISFGANMSFGDNNKAIFGAGSDLQIYHNASNSYVQDVGTGKLHITSDGTGVSIDKGTSELMATFDTDGAVTLYYDNASKLATTSTGVRIQSTADQNLDLLTTGTNADNRINFGDSDDADIGRIYYQHNGNNMLFYTNAQERVKISGAGDVEIANGNLVVASGHGIDFSATGNSSGTTDSEILYDYEEGNWNPVVYDTNTSGHVLTLNNVIGKYKKIGNWVNCTLQVGRNDATSLSGVITLTNLPFTVAAQGSVTGGTFWLDKTSSDRIGVIYVVPSADRFYLLSDHAVDNYLLMSEWQNARPIYIQVSYNSA
tara:strand:+ start:770 stop:2209 length:1440 start_codon:yes stop_codon:yes gene_type:complete